MLRGRRSAARAALRRRPGLLGTRSLNARSQSARNCGASSSRSITGYGPNPKRLTPLPIGLASRLSGSLTARRLGVAERGRRPACPRAGDAEQEDAIRTCRNDRRPSAVGHVRPAC